MSFEVFESGPEKAPLLACIPGLMGSAEDFRRMNEGLEDRFRILWCTIQPDEAPSRGTIVGTNYQKCALELESYLSQKHSGKRVHFAAYSIGSKVVYHFMVHRPEIFGGALVTDLTPGSLEPTSLYQHLVVQTNKLDLHQEWKVLKGQLDELFPNKHLKIFVKSQLHYPDKDGPAQWKGRDNALENSLKDSSGIDLMKELQKLPGKIPVTAKLKIVQCEEFSGLTSEAVQTLSRLDFVEFHFIPQSTHFVHVNHVDELRTLVLSLTA